MPRKYRGAKMTAWHKTYLVVCKKAIIYGGSPRFQSRRSFFALARQWRSNMFSPRRSPQRFPPFPLTSTTRPCLRRKSADFQRAHLQSAKFLRLRQFLFHPQSRPKRRLQQVLLSLIGFSRALNRLRFHTRPFQLKSPLQLSRRRLPPSYPPPRRRNPQ